MDSSKYIAITQSNVGDRRCARFVVPGATVSLEMGGLGQRRKDLSSKERSPVVDLSKGGMSFLTDSPPRLSRVVLLLAYSEEEDPIRLEGRIVYFMPRGAGLSYRYRVGVEFIPFTRRRGHNSLESLGRLERLEMTFGHKDVQEPPPESPGG